MKTNKQGLRALTTSKERREIRAVGTRGTKLQYLKGSAQCGLRLWNLLAPQLPDYQTFGGANGYPTFSLDTLKQKGLIWNG